jgi:hypothetical protein
MSAWDLDDTVLEDADEDRDIDDDDVFTDIDYGQEDLEKIDSMMIVDQDDDQ